jgi:transcriptional regulator with XRE-family HTH domain
MDFPKKLTELRKERNLTQKALAEKIGIHITQVQRYENGSTQPTLDVIRKLAITLAVSADELIFGKQERGPDESIRLQFEAISEFDEEDKQLAVGLLEGLILKHQAKQHLERQKNTKKK